MKIVVSALHFDWRDIADCVRRVTAEFGVDGVELSWERSFRRPHCTPGDLDDLAALAGRDALALSSHVWPDLAQLGVEAGRGELLRWLELCGRTGVRDLVIHGGTFAPRREGIARTREILAGALPAFERASVVLNLENHYAYGYRGGNELFSEPWEFAEVLSLQSPSLAFCLDTGHAHMTRNADALVGALAPWLRYIHLADNCGVHDDHRMYRQGTVAWDDLFDSLARALFDGTFCVEFPVREDPEPFRRCRADLRRRWGARPV